VSRRNIKEQILALRQEGKTLAAIKRTLNCSYSTIAYHLYEKAKRSTYTRVTAEARSRYNKTVRGILAQKLSQFRRLGRYHKISDERKFTINDLQFGDKPTCYLTGTLIDLSNPSEYSFDHKLPTSKGGTNDISNLGLCLSQANRAKSDLTHDEFIALCTKILAHHGYTVFKDQFRANKD
jgi:CRISPR/Cas system Type II protein with McrA/HNH and RuvC-like nuclease domain